MSGFLICSKHNRTEKTAAKVPTNTFICMHSDCPHSYRVLCNGCKNDHKDHSNKVLTIEDATFLVDRLMTTPFKEVANHVSESVDIMKKLKLIKQFRKKIDAVEKQIQKDALQLVDNTEQLIHQYAACKENASKLHKMLGSIANIRMYKQFTENSHELLSSLEYNAKKDKFQFADSLLQGNQEKRRNLESSARRKILQVRDYSMKIIEVILHNDDSEEEENDSTYKQKQYDALKQELSLERDEIELKQKNCSIQNIQANITSTKTKKAQREIHTQTNQEVISKLEATSELEHKINELKQNHLRSENDFRLKLSAVIKQKQTSNRELTKMKGKFEESKKTIHEIEVHLQQNKGQRVQKQKVREQMVKKIADLWQWKGSSSEDKVL